MKRVSLGILSALLLSSCMIGGEDEVESPSVWSDPTIDGRIANIKAGLTEIRGRTFSRPVHTAIISPEAYQQLVAWDADAYYTPDMNRAVSRELAQLGFFQDTLMSMKSIWTGFVGSFPAGYYIPGKDSIYILSPYSRDEYFMTFGLPHELVHVLQDHDLDAFNPGRVEGNPAYYAGDFSSARSCLIEGDAEFTAVAYAAKYNLDDPAPFQFSREEARRRDNGLRWFREVDWNLRFFLPSGSPYDLGMRNVADIYDAGGYAAVDSLYDRPNRTSYSVLTNENVEPEAIDLDWLPLLLGETGDYVDDYGNGSLQMLTLFGSWISRERFERGMGWRGDRLFYKISPKDTWGAMVWVQSYVDPAAAKSAFSDLALLTGSRFKKNGKWYPTKLAEYPGPWTRGISREGNGLKTILILKGREVWWVEGTGDKTAAVIQGLEDRALAPVAAASGQGLPKQSAAEGRQSRILPPGGDKIFFHPWPRKR